MKKFICFCIICFSFLCFYGFGKVKELPVEFKNSAIQIFTSTQNQNHLPYKNIKNGNGLVYFSHYNNIDTMLKNLVGVSGVTYILQGDYNSYCDLQNKLKIKTIEKTKDSCVGFSDYFGITTHYKNKKVNVQMCFSENKIYVGTPLILGCY